MEQHYTPPEISRIIETQKSIRQVIEDMTKLQANLMITISPYAKAGSNKKTAKALKKILDGFQELTDAMFISVDRKHIPDFLIMTPEPRAFDVNKDGTVKERLV